MKLKCWSKTEKTNSAPSGATETIPIPRWDDAESRRPASGAGQEWSRYGFERNCASVRRRGLALSRKVEAALNSFYLKRAASGAYPGRAPGARIVCSESGADT